MNIRRFVLCLALFAVSPLFAADVNLVMPTGAEVACDQIQSLRFADMPRLYGVNNFSDEYKRYVHLRTVAPQACARVRARAAMVQHDLGADWKAVAANETSERAR